MNREELFNLCAYIAASAAGLREEPKTYGPLRLLEVLSRLARLAAAEHGDAFLREVAEEVEKKQALVMTDSEGFYRFVEGLVTQFAREAKRRSLPGQT